MYIAAVLLILTICLIVTIFGLGLPWYINQVTNDRLKRLEEAILNLGVMHDKQSEALENLGNFTNNLNFQMQVDRYNYQDHLNRWYHGEKDHEGIIKFWHHDLTEHEDLQFRNYGIQLNNFGRFHGYLPRHDMPEGGANVS